MTDISFVPKGTLYGNGTGVTAPGATRTTITSPTLGGGSGERIIFPFFNY